MTGFFSFQKMIIMRRRRRIASRSSGYMLGRAIERALIAGAFGTSALKAGAHAAEHYDKPIKEQEVEEIIQEME